MYNLFNGDCLELMKNIPDKSIDCIICDLPYETTRNTWDIAIPFDALWDNYKRIIKDNGAILLFGQDKFTAKCMLSNEKWHRYNLIWKKVLPSGFLNANRMPLREHEDIMVFYKKKPVYNPQKIKGKPCHSKGRAIGKTNEEATYGAHTVMETVGDMKHPTSVLEFAKPHPSIVVHPTQKPVGLLEWLIKTYTSEGDTVLDNCMGSGTTGIACINTNRNFIGMELNDDFFNIAKERIEKHSEVLQNEKNV